MKKKKKSAYHTKRPVNPHLPSAVLVRRIRDRFSWSNVKLARRLKVSIWTVWMWQAGVVVPSEKNQLKLKVLARA
jgi:DNA-binding transcriptional regulator YiaG